MSAIDKITSLEKKNENNRLEAAKLEERAKTLNEELAVLQATLKERGITEDKLTETIANLEQELNKQIAYIESTLNA